MYSVFKSSAALAAALFFSTTAHAQVNVDDAWVRATVPQQQATGAFMTLTSKTDTTLVQAESTVAKHTEVHEMVTENNVMKMRQVQGVRLPAGESVHLKPGGYHIMLLDLHGQVRVGEEVPLKLIFEDPAGVRSSVELRLPVRPLASSGAQGHGHGHTPAHSGAKH